METKNAKLEFFGGTTSEKAFEIATMSGLLRGRRLEVFKDLCEHAPCTQLETWRRVAPHSNSGTITTRFSELERMKLIKVVGERRDSLTGMDGKLYDLTGDTPKALEKNDAPTIKDPYEIGWADALARVAEIARSRQGAEKISYQVRIEIESICKEAASA